MDWPEQKQNYQKQPPDKKNKPKYVAKDQLQGQKSQKVQEKPAFVSKPQRKYENNNQGNNYKKYQQRPKQENLQRPKFIEKVSSTTESMMNCMICSQAIKKKEPTWTCQACCITLHLKCIKQWIKKTNENKPEEDKKFLVNWSCIQCKTEYNENMPQYYCFCGKFKNPQYDRDLEPHSCGKPCQRKRGTYCPHLCPQLCHSGKCPPCDYEGSIVKCNCGKTQRMAKCSEERAIFQCGKKCQKYLKCGKHKCQRNCHYGQCFPCKKKHLVSCFCGKNEDVVDCVEKSYACEAVCEKLLSCGFHKCQQDCHEGPCRPCKKTPQLQKTCHCGRYQLMMISQSDRESCQDPIPSCGMPCKKKLPCGHECPQMCHEGRCRDCKVIVQQSCRCGTTQRKIQCWKSKLAKQQFHCDTICKKKRSCGIHVCNTQCCKFKSLIGPDTHICELTCQRMLNCEKHTCDLPCHAGLCKKCPVIYSQPQPCPCGATSLKPPVICGTNTPECDNVCGKQMTCGHKCQQFCHYGICRCQEQVDVTCRCGSSKIKTTCGRQALCLNKCQKNLQCGHKCLVQCHSGTCKEANKDGCFKKCQKDRSDCGHKCKQICHLGKKCQQFPCEAEILIKCECGNRQTTLLCGSQGSPEGIHKKKQILCNKKCQNMKRFDIIYKGKEIYYPNALMQYGFRNFPYLQRLEERLQKFISESDAHFIQVQFKAGDHQSRMALHNLFENHYHLNTHFYRHAKSATFTLTQTQNTMIPKPCLSEYIKQVAKGYIKRTNLPFEYTVKFDGEAREKVDIILKSLKDYLHKYYVQRKDKMVYVHFWNKQEGQQAQGFLESEFQTMHFYGEENLAKMEELEEPIELAQIVETQIKQQPQETKLVKQEQAQPQTKQLQAKEEQKEVKQQTKTQQNAEKLQVQTQKIEKKNQDAKKQQNDKKTEQKPKIIMKSAKQSSKLIIRKGAPNFIRSQFPPSSENVQDLYVIDDDELYGDPVDWDAVIKELLEKKMGIQASEWRIRALVMISSFHKFDQKILRDEFVRIIDLYEKDKERAKRILQLQRLEPRKIQQEMKGNQIYLSDHEPEIMSYCILHNYFASDKIQFQLTDQCAETKEVQRSLEFIENVDKLNYEEFYTEFKNCDYLTGCAIIEFVHKLRQNFMRQINKKNRVPSQNLWTHLLFDSEQELVSYAKLNGLIIGRRISKSKKIDQFTLIQGELIPELIRDDKFKEKINAKREKAYFLAEPEELVNQKWMTRTFFAFGDFKQSMSTKYMLALCRKLRDN